MRSLNDDNDAANFFADLPHTHDRRNPYIFPSVETNPLKVLNLVDALEGADPSWLFECFIAGCELLSTLSGEAELTTPSQPIQTRRSITSSRRHPQKHR